MGICSGWTCMLRADLLQPADDDPVVRLQPLGDHAQAVLLERPGRDPAVLDLVLGVDHVDVLQPLVRADGPVDDQQRLVRLADRQADRGRTCPARAAGRLAGGLGFGKTPRTRCCPWSG